MRDMGEMVTQGQTDAQYMFLRQRLQALDTGWNELHKMWENRQNLLTQSTAYQLFLRDTKQAEAFLNNQVHTHRDTHTGKHTHTHTQTQSQSHTQRHTHR